MDSSKLWPHVSRSSPSDDDDLFQSGSDSSGDEFDSADDRVNQILSSLPTHSPRSSSSSDDSDSESESSHSKRPLLPPADSIDNNNGVLASQQDNDVMSGSALKETSPATVLSRHSKATALQKKEPKCRKKIGMEEAATKTKLEDGQSLKKTKADVSKVQEKDSNDLQNGNRSGSKHNSSNNGKEKHKDVQISGQHAKKVKDSTVASSVKSESLVRSRDDDAGDKGHSIKRRKGGNALETERMNNVLDKNDKVPKPMVVQNMDVANEISRTSDDNLPAEDSGLITERKSTKTDTERRQGNVGNQLITEQPIPAKQNKPHVWSFDEEVVLASEILNHVKLGMEIPTKKTDDFWTSLSEMLKEKLGLEMSNEQLSLKVRRMKQRHQAMAQKVKACQHSEEAYKHRSASEQQLFNIWSQIWGKAESTLDDGNDPGQQTTAEHIGAENVQRDCSGKESDIKNMPPKLHSNIETIGKEAKDLPITPNPGNFNRADACSFDALAVQKIIRDETRAVVNILENELAKSMEDWRNAVAMLARNSVNIPGNQSRLMTIGEFQLNADTMVFERFPKDHDFSQQWCDLQLQKLDIDARKLQILLEECDLKEKLLKLQLQHKRNNQK